MRKLRKERPHIVNQDLIKAEFVYDEVYAFKVTMIFVARVLHFSAFIKVAMKWAQSSDHQQPLSYSCSTLILYNSVCFNVQCLK